jgi:hypothetical protein
MSDTRGNEGKSSSSTFSRSRSRTDLPCSRRTSPEARPPFRPRSAGVAGDDEECTQQKPSASRIVDLHGFPCTDPPPPGHSRPRHTPSTPRAPVVCPGRVSLGASRYLMSDTRGNGGKRDRRRGGGGWLSGRGHSRDALSGLTRLEPGQPSLAWHDESCQALFGGHLLPRVLHSSDVVGGRPSGLGLKTQCTTPMRKEL